ncbi:hypothetical protein CXB51_036253 [Gossypium anomalum]|uniref:DUF7745 domain-containing protein n=1 Tax=Gossypium anomalum TaxID=47600 RepID=A0A8J5Y064_9ROSI|nr:hypothetical protein CXB51_036253 [Gossypium anomalum]
MEELIIQTTEKNTVVRDWSLKTQKEKWDSLMEGCVSNLPEHVAMNVRQNNLEDLDPAYQCFTFNQEDMTPTIEEYAALLRIDNVQFYKIYVKEPKLITFKKKLMRFGSKPPRYVEEGKSIRFDHLQSDRFPKSSWTYRSHSRFIECAQLLNVWILSHFWKVERTPFHMFSKIFTPLESYLEKEWPKEVTEQHWVSVFLNLRAKDVTWRAPWIRPSVLLYNMGNQDWVPLLGLWGGVGYAPLMVQRVRDTVKSWKKIHLMELALYADTLTQDYDIWRKQRTTPSRILSRRKCNLS